MKKTILTIMVAAMMLVAFTACEQQPVDVNGYVPTMITVVQNGVIMEGQPITADMFTATVTYKNGETAVIPATVKDGKASASLSETVKGSVDVVVTYATSATVNDVKANDFNLNQSGATSNIKLNDNYTITLTNGANSYTVDSKNSYFDSLEVKIADGTKDINTNVAGTTSVDLTVTRTGNAAAAAADAGYSAAIATESTVDVTVLPSNTPDTKITDIYVVVVKDKDAALDKLEILDNPWVDEGDVVVLGYNADKEIVKILTAETDYVLIGDALPTDGDLPAGTTADPAAKGTVYLASDATVRNPYSISGKDYVSAIAVTTSSVTKAPGSTFGKTDVGTVTATFASGATKDVTSTTTVPSISIPAVVEEAVSLTVNATYTNEKNNPVTTPITISITATPSASPEEPSGK